VSNCKNFWQFVLKRIRQKKKIKLREFVTEFSFFKIFLAKWRKFTTEKYLQRNEG
jgi:hypothetical protein